MHNDVAAWQLDIFGVESPVVVTGTRPDPLPNPSQWSESVLDGMADALYHFACDRRKNDELPESITDSAKMLGHRLRPRQKARFDMADYKATLGWIMGFWEGAVPYKHVCEVGGVPVEWLQNFILDNPLLKRDMEEVRRECFGSLL